MTMILKMCHSFKLHNVNLHERADFIKSKSLHNTCTRDTTQLEINYLKHHTIRTATQATTEKLTTITYGLENSTGSGCMYYCTWTDFPINKNKKVHVAWPMALFFFFGLFGKNNKIKQKRFMQKIKIRLVKSETA